MAILPTLFRSPSRSILNFADERAREADSIGSVITKLAAPLVNQPQPLGTAPVQRMAATPADYVPPTANQPSTTTFGTNDLVNRLPQNVNTDPDYWLNVKPFERPPSALDPQSLEKLAIGDHRLQTLMAETARRAKEQGIDFKVSETARDQQRQAELVAAGKSQTMNSKHLTGNAADIYVVGPDGQPNWDFAAYQPVADIAKEVAAELGYDDFVWGGDWNTLKDGVHFQLGGVSGGDGANSMIGGAGADTLGGGGMNVESILASLYPQMSPEEEKRQRRKDIFLALSQGLGAISQGRPVDVSNVVARSDERKRQAVLDMRERERARAAGSLVASQGGAPEMVAGVVSGAINYGDFLTDRERRRVEKEADANRLKQEQANGQLAGIVDTMWPQFGLPESVKEQVIASIKAGADPTTIFTLNEQAQIAEAARKAEEEAAATKEQRAAAIDSLAASTDPVDQMTARVLALDPNISLKDAEAIARERLKPTTEEFAPSEPQKIWSESLAALPTEEERKAFRELYPTPAALGMALRQKDGGPTFFVGTDANGMSTVTGVTGGPQGATTAAPAPAVAPQGIAGAFTSQFGPMATGVPAGGAAPAAPTAVAPATTTAVPALPLPVQTALTELKTKEQELRATIAQSADQNAKLTAERELAQIQAQKAAALLPYDAPAAQVALDTAKQTLSQQIATAPSGLRKAELEADLLALQVMEAEASQGTDAATREATLRGLQAEADKKELEVAALERDEKSRSSAAYSESMRKYALMENAAGQIWPDVFSGWATGLAGGLASTYGQYLDSPGTRTTLLSYAGQIAAMGMIDSLQKMKAAGVSLTPASNLDAQAAAAAETALANAKQLDGEGLANALSIYQNYVKDELVGPKDLVRIDKYGQEYEVTQNTLGVTPDTFSMHWAQIPNEVAAAWKAGELTTLPTDDPAYAEAANVINAMTTNWELYQGNLDRTKVGEPEASPSEPTAETGDAALPPPPSSLPAEVRQRLNLTDDMSEEEWQSVWPYLSEEAKNAYRAAVEGNQ